jgi:ABC-type sugar transport system substrate-binding protein
MNTHVRRFTLLCAAGLFAFTAGTAPAQAANNRASCVGIIVSTYAPAGMLDVNDYKDAAKDLEYDTFGRFVADGARQHAGSLKDCEP